MSSGDDGDDLDRQIVILAVHVQRRRSQRTRRITLRKWGGCDLNGLAERNTFFVLENTIRKLPHKVASLGNGPQSLGALFIAHDLLGFVLHIGM